MEYEEVDDDTFARQAARVFKERYNVEQDSDSIYGDGGSERSAEKNN